MEEIQLALDTQIVLIAWQVSNIPCLPCHTSLVKEFEKRVYLALDGEDLDRGAGHIVAEYHKKMNKDSPARKWLQYLFTHNRVRFHKKLARMPQGLLVRLGEAHFDPEDYKFVRLCADYEYKVYSRRRG